MLSSIRIGVPTALALALFLSVVAVTAGASSRYELLDSAKEFFGFSIEAAPAVSLSAVSEESSPMNGEKPGEASVGLPVAAAPL